jgi:hypothetical protein
MTADFTLMDAADAQAPRSALIRFRYSVITSSSTSSHQVSDPIQKTQVPYTFAFPSIFNCNYAAICFDRPSYRFVVHNAENTKFDTPQWILLGSLAPLLGLENSRASPRVLNDEAEEVEGAEEEHLLGLKEARSIMAIEGEAGAIRAGADEGKGKVQATVEDMLQRKEKRP